MGINLECRTDFWLDNWPYQLHLATWYFNYPCLGLCYLFGLREVPTLAEVSFIVFTAALILSKVYSPQYVLWLTALAVIAIKTKETLIMFWVWQIAELAYHVAIWQHLALITDAKFGLSQSFYGAISLLRLVAAIAMIFALVRQVSRSRFTQGKPWDFLFNSASSYP